MDPVGGAFALVADWGVEGVAFASVIGAWINVVYLYVVLVRRDYYRIPLKLVGRIARQLVAAAAMGAALWFARDLLTGWYDAGLFARAGALIALIIPFEYHRKLRRGVDLDVERRKRLNPIVLATGAVLVALVVKRAEVFS